MVTLSCTACMSSMLDWISWYVLTISMIWAWSFCVILYTGRRSLYKVFKGMEINHCFFLWFQVPSSCKDFTKCVYAWVCWVNNFQCFYDEWKNHVEMLVRHVSFRPASFTHTNQRFCLPIDSQRVITMCSNSFSFFGDELKWIVMFL